MTASVELIKALGGGWSDTQLPTPKDLTQKQPKPTPSPSPTPVIH